MAAKHDSKEAKAAIADALAREVATAVAGGALVFAINGEKKILSAAQVDASITLNDYIRRHTKLKGTKLSCGEGGCGACAVRLSRFDAATQKVVTISVNSCLRPLATLDGWAVTTTEGLGNSGKGYHPVQERIVQFNGTQCGFCTPGMVMTTHVALINAGETGVTMKEIEEAFDGNICRCTGYRPILDAAKSFAKDSDIEDMVCKHKTEAKYDRSKDPEFPDWLRTYVPAPLRFTGSNGTTWVRPTTLEAVFEVLATTTVPQKDIKILVSNTGSGIYKEEYNAPLMVNVGAIPELNVISHSDAGLTVGAAVSLDGLVAAMRTAAATKEPFATSSYEAMIAHINKIANVHVRSVGALGGNLSMAKKNGFLSDLATVLVGNDARVTVTSRAHTRTITLLDFLSTPTFAPGELLQSVLIPWNVRGDVYRSYKVALRPTNSHAFCNAAFKLNVDAKTNTVVHANLTFGGVMAYDIPGAHAIRATRTEAALVGKGVTQETLQSALAVLALEVVPEGERAAYRGRLCKSYFYKFFLEILGDAVSPAVRSATVSLQRTGISRGSQKFELAEGKDTHKPVYEPIHKIGAPLQASGEATFIDDMPITPDTLFGAYVPADVATGKITNIDATAALAYPGVVRFISAKDVPGVNLWAIMPDEQNPIFADPHVTYHQQPVGVIVADTLRHAQDAAKLVKIEYSKGFLGLFGSKTPIVGLAQAREHKSYWEDAKKEAKRGDDPEPVLSADAHLLTGTVHLGSQCSFYMEPNTAYAMPEEDGSMVVWSSNQSPDTVHRSVVAALGVKTHKVKILMRRLGGGFGGKFLHPHQLACAAAIAAQVTGRPVRMALDRNMDMSLVGGRTEIEEHYRASCNADGKLSAVAIAGVVDCGEQKSMGATYAETLGKELPQVYNTGNYHAVWECAKTNTFSRGPVRGPAELEAAYGMETILEHVAHVTGLAPELVRERNFFHPATDAKLMVVPGGGGDKTPPPDAITHYTIPHMWAQLKIKSNFNARAHEVEQFNRANRWKKRGIAMTPCRYQVGTSLGASAYVSVYADGSISLACTGAEMGQGLHTKVAQVVAYQLSRVFGEGKNMVPFDLVRIEDMQTNILPGGGYTGGSVTSEKCAEAARRAADVLVERLRPVLVGLKQQMEKKAAGSSETKEIPWPALCAAATEQSVQLVAEGRHRGFEGNDVMPPVDYVSYQNYGAAVSEVELDVLTGEIHFKRADIFYDIGKSVNPAVDIGQVEGAFLIGYGLLFREEVKHDSDGRVTTASTWTYKPPMNRDVPADWNIELINTKFDKPGALLGSKAVGEPPIVLAASAIMAVRRAVTAARRDAGHTDFFALPVPATPEVLQQLCAVDAARFTLDAPPAAPAKST